MPKTAEPWSLTSLRDKLIKIGVKIVSHGRAFQMAEGGVAADVPGNPVAHRPAAGAAGTGRTGRSGQMRQTTTVEVRLDEDKAASTGATRPSLSLFWLSAGRRRSNFVAARLAEADSPIPRIGNLGNVGLSCRASGESRVRMRTIGEPQYGR